MSQKQRWLLFIGIIITFIALSLNMPLHVMRFLFVGVVLLAVVVAIYQRYQRDFSLRDFSLRNFSVRDGWRIFRQASQQANILSGQIRQNERMRLLARLLALGALASLLKSWELFTPTNFYQDGLDGWGYVALAFVLAVVPLWVFLPRHIGMGYGRILPQDKPIRWHIFLLGVLMWLILVQSTLIRPFFQGTLPHHVQAFLFGAGILFMTLGLGGWHYQGNFWSALRPRRTWLPMAGILTLAVFVRVYNLEYGIHRFVDEIHFASAVSRLWYGGEQALLMPHDSITAFTWMYPYIQSLIAGVTGPSLTGLRLASVIFGVVQVWGIYLLTSHLLNRRAGFFVALTLATFPPHVHFSRIGLNNIADPTFGILAMAFFVRGLRERRQMDFALSGMMLGLTTYFYEGGRIFYAPFMVMWLLWVRLFVERGMSFRLPTRRHWVIWGVGAVTLIGSFYYVWTQNFVRLFPRYETVDGNFFGVFEEILTGDSLRVAWQYVQVPLLNYVASPSYDTFFHGSQPYIIWWTVPFFLIGWGVALWRIRRLDGSLVFWWMMGVTVANMVMGPLIQSPRYVVGYPALAMSVGLGAYWLVEWGGALLGKFNRVSAQRLLGGVFIGVISISQMIYYHGNFLPMYYQRQFYHEYVYGVRVYDADDVLFRAVQLPLNTYVHFVSREFFGSAGYGAALTYYGRHRDINFQTLYPRELTETYLLALPPTITHAFFIEPDDSASFVTLQSVFDLVGPEFSPYPIPNERQMALYMAYPTERSLNDVRRWRSQEDSAP